MSHEEHYEFEIYTKLNRETEMYEAFVVPAVPPEVDIEPPEPFKILTFSAHVIDLPGVGDLVAHTVKTVALAMIDNVGREYAQADGDKDATCEVVLKEETRDIH